MYSDQHGITAVTEIRQAHNNYANTFKQSDPRFTAYIGPTVYFRPTHVAFYLLFGNLTRLLY
jgi:hypothetical protein